MHLIPQPQTSTSSDHSATLTVIEPSRSWTVEASAAGQVWTLSATSELLPGDLAQLAEELEAARQSGRDVALVCEAGVARSTLEAVHFHRFVDVFETARAAHVWLSLSSTVDRVARAA